MSDDILKKLFKAPTKNPVFEVGQTVRVISRIDVNMPSHLSYWLNTECEVLSVVPRGFVGRQWCYELKHPNGSVCEFNLDELDSRYIKKVK